MARYKIAVIPGDGIGPEVVKAAMTALEAVEPDFEFIQCEAGYDLWKKTGKQITVETIDLIKSSQACLKGPTTTPAGPETYRSVASILRQSLDLYANVRPIKSRRGVRCLYHDVDLVIVRENTEGLYKGLEFRIRDAAFGVRVITEYGCERIARFAFELAASEGRKKVTAIHKANVLKETCGLFREACSKVAGKYPKVQFEELYVDNAAFKIVTNPRELDVLVTTNMFGDILSDEAAGLIGGLGMASSASIGDDYSMFEPVHGTAPDIAGKGTANPSAMILSSVLMLRHLNEEKAASKLENALNRVLEEGRAITPDIGGKAKTVEMVEAIVKKLQ